MCSVEYPDLAKPSWSQYNVGGSLNYPPTDEDVDEIRHVGHDFHLAHSRRHLYLLKLTLAVVYAHLLPVLTNGTLTPAYRKDPL